MERSNASSARSSDSFGSHNGLESKVEIIDFRTHSFELLASKEINDLKKRIRELEMDRATKIGQDKIVGFVAGAFILSVISILAPFFIDIDRSRNGRTNNEIVYVAMSEKYSYEMPSTHP